jgi:hypothetical protein
MYIYAYSYSLNGHTYILYAYSYSLDRDRSATCFGSSFLRAHTLVDVAATMGRPMTMSIMPVVLGRLLVLQTIHAIYISYSVWMEVKVWWNGSVYCF